MNFGRKTVSQRLLAMLLCAAMVLSYIVLPGSATEATDSNTAAETTSPKLTLTVNNVNTYKADEPVLIHGGSIESLGITDFISNEVSQFIDLMPTASTLKNDSSREDYCVATFTFDGDTVTITNQASYSYAYTYPNLAVDTKNYSGLYVEYSGTSSFNILVYYTKPGETDPYSHYFWLNSGDLAASANKTYALKDITDATWSDTITITECKFYSGGGTTGTSVTLYDVRLINAPSKPDPTTDTRTGSYMDGYNAVIVDYKGGVGTQEGASGAEYQVSAVLDCSKGLDFPPQQLTATTDKGFVLYIPKDQELPAVGDYVATDFVAGSPAAGTLEFYDYTQYNIQQDALSGVNVNKTATPVQNTDDEFLLTLEAFATGTSSSSVSTKPADIVLVLDQSASMYAPRGADSDQYTRWDDPDRINSITGIGKIDTSVLATAEAKEKGSRLGYYVAQSKTPNRYASEVAGNADYNGDGDKTDTSVPMYDWFIVQYVDGIGWVYVRVDETTESVAVASREDIDDYVSGSGTQYGMTLVSADIAGSVITDFYYYESQYAALYESVTEFVDKLAATGVDHRVAITGFASPYYDGIEYYDGSGLYIDGTYYKYDTEYRYMGYTTTANIHGYMLYVPDTIYASMSNILPPELEDVTWSRSLPVNATLVYLDPNKSNSAGTDIAGNGKKFKKGEYFAPVPAESALYSYNKLTQEQYKNALVSVKDDAAAVKASVEAIRTNYQQTCPAVGLEMAQKIFAEYETTGRDKIVILFTDGTPTVSLEANREYGETGDAGIKETYYSGLAGAKDAVTKAEGLKESGVQIYTIGTSGLVDPIPNAYGVTFAENAERGSVSGEVFLAYVSSEYTNVASTHKVATPDGNNTILSQSVLTITGTKQTDLKVDYTKTSADGSISVAFGSIMESQFTSNVNLDGSAVLKDVMSEHFDLKTRSTQDIIVSIAPYVGKTILGEHIFGDPATLVNATTEQAEILSGITATLQVPGVTDNYTGTEIVVNVTGFDYSANHVRVEDGVAKGYKIIVQIPIKTAEGFNGGDDVPTNAPTSGIYGSQGLVQEFPIPEVDVPGVVSDKYVEKAENDEFVITLEGYATGSTKEMTITKPADIVLVLDQSGSMRTPVGAPDVLKSGEAVPNGLTPIDRRALSVTKAKHTGYYVAYDTVDEYWYIMEHRDDIQKEINGTVQTVSGWRGYKVNNTEAIIDPGVAGTQYGYIEYTEWQGGYVLESLVFYKSQYAVLYDSILEFVAGLKETGAEHNVAIVGFAGAGGGQDGSGLYVGSAGENNGGFKHYKNALYHENTTAARRTELYQLAMKNVQDETEYDELLSNIHSIETNYSFTCPAIGLQLANEVYEANDVDLLERDRIVVLFTDGIPNRTFADQGVGDTDTAGTVITQDYIYNEIVQKAYESKNTYGANLYSISTTTMSGNRNFLKYASSDYPNATSYTNPGSSIAEPKYTSEVSGLDGLQGVFNTITTTVSGTTVTLDTSAMLVDILTDYFDLVPTDPNDLRTAVKVYTQVYDGNGGWGNKVAFNLATVTISSTNTSGRDNKISVSGFNYADEFISDTPRPKTDANGNTVDYYGSKLVVEVAIKGRDGFWGGNDVPTNDPDSGIYANGERVQKLPEPTVDIVPKINANDVTVYYGESDLGHDDLMGSATVDGVEVTIDENGNFIPSEDWMDDFASIKWTDDSANINTTVSNTEPGDYTYSVTFTPTDGTAQTLDATGHAYILVPVVTFKDSTIDYGFTPNAEYFKTTNLVSGVEWVAMNGEEPTVEVSGMEPTLSYTYEPVGTVDGSSQSNYYKTDTKIDVTVTSSNLVDGNGDITDQVTFQWVSCHEKLHGTDHDTYVIDEHQGTADSHEFWIHVYTLADTVVIDFGLSVDIHVLANDNLWQAGNPKLVGIVNELPAAKPAWSEPDTIADSCNGTFGVIRVGNDGSAVDNETADFSKATVRYTLNANNGMEMNKHETFYYVIEYTVDGSTAYYYGELTIIPATTIYFEDNFVDYTIWENGEKLVDVDGKDVEWNTAPENSTPSQSIQDEDRPGEGLSDALNNYGYDGHYTNMTTYSNGTARWVTVSGDKYAKATFTFWGTGFDVISVTSADTGTIVIEVDDLNKSEGAEGDKTYYIVDTYYGYVFEDGKWIVNPAAEDALYQVPVMKVENLDYGHYTVTITATYADFFDHDQNDNNGSYDFYLDAIRIYDPANKGTDNEVIKGAYIADGEYLPTYQELRNLLIDKDTFDIIANTEDVVNGVVFIDGNKTLSDSSSSQVVTKDKGYAISDYLNFGPNNELYLASNQAVAFKLEAGTLVTGEDETQTLDTSNIASLQLALKTVGNSAKVKIGYYDGSQIVWLESFGGDTGKSIATATDLYYDITDLNGKTVIIMNVEGILSITNIKTTHKSDPKGTAQTMVYVRSRDIQDTTAALNAELYAEVEGNPQTGDMAFEFLTLTVLTACVMMLAVLTLPCTRRKNVK